MGIEDGTDIPERTKEGRTSLEEEVGSDGAVIAMAIYLTFEEPTVPLTDILRNLNRSGLDEYHVIEILSNAKFRRVSFTQAPRGNNMIPVDDEEGNYWMRPVGRENSTNWSFTNDEGEQKNLDEDRITKLVKEHMLAHPVIDFNLGGPPDKEALDSAPSYPPGYEGMIDPWLSDSPGTVSI